MLVHRSEDRAARRRRHLAALALSAAALGSPAMAADPAASPAEDPAASPRPRVGIAFAGGGAKGCAHIGVLRVLDEMRIPVDYAAGTSMGAIIGGLYASGMDADQLEEVVLTVDWADALVDTPSRKDLVFRRKDDDLRYIQDVEAGIGRGGLTFPTGLRSGQKLNYLLRRFTLPVRTVRDFDELPVPFRAVATDISTGEMVVLEGGDLARALRASMAIPSLFSAVEIDGRLLVDGGVTNNVPVDVVRAMGADVVIAIDLGGEPKSEAQVGRSFLTILSQTLGMLTRSNMVPRLADADLVMSPETGAYGILEFDAAAAIIEAGEAEARRFAAELAALAVSEEEYAAWKASRRREPDPLPVVTAVRFEGNRRVDDRVIAGLIGLAPGAPFSAETARDDLARIFGLGDFESIDVELIPAGAGAEVVYQLREKPWGPHYLRFGLFFEVDDQGSNSLSVLAQVNSTRLNALGAEWKSELQLGPDRVLRTELYQPLSFERGWFVLPAVELRDRRIPIFTGGEEVAELGVESIEARLDLGYTFGRYGELRLGAAYASADVGRESGVPPPDVEARLGEHIDRGALLFDATADRLDSAKLPKDGSRVALTALAALEALGSDAEYAKVELHASRYHTWGRNTVFGNLAGGSSLDDPLPAYEQFPLGGLFSLSGFESFELTGDHYGLLRAGYYRRISKLFHLGGYVEVADVGPEIDQLADDPVVALTALLVADTVAGPLYAGLGTADGGETTLYLLFGRSL